MYAIRSYYGSNEQLRESQELLLMAQEIGKSGCWAYSPESSMIWQSAEASRIYGFPPIAREYSLPDLNCCIGTVLKGPAFGEFIEGKIPSDILFTLNPVDGSPSRTIHAISRRDLAPDGRLVRVVGIIQDITEQYEVS